MIKKNIRNDFIKIFINCLLIKINNGFCWIFKQKSSTIFSCAFQIKIEQMLRAQSTINQNAYRGLIDIFF